jgi:hypothetical protein
MMLLIAVGEGPYPSTPAEWIGLLFYPLGISAGMILAWWREGFGGVITVGSLLVFYVIHFATSGAFPKGWAWLAFATPGFLFLLYWERSRSAQIKEQSGPHV